MAEFIELREIDGEKVLINKEHVIKLSPDKNGSYIYFDIVMTNGSGTYPYPFHVADDYESVKRKLLS